MSQADSLQKNSGQQKQQEAQSDEAISQLLERGQALRLAMTQCLVDDDEPWLASLDATKDIDLPDLGKCQETVLDYLLGKHMTEEDEARVLETLSDLPMVDNILEALERPEEKKDSPLDDTLESVDALTPRSRVLSIAGSMRLKVCSLELSETGLRHMAPPRHSAPRHTPPSFLLEYLPPRSCLGQQNNPVRLCSRRVAGRNVTFGQEKLHSCESSKPLIFKIYYRNHPQRTPIVLGCAQFEWDRVLSSDKLSCEINLPVHHVSKAEVLGRLKLKVQLGQAGKIFETSKQRGQHREEQSTKSHFVPRSLYSKTLSQPPSVRSYGERAEVLEVEQGSTKAKAILLQGLIHITQSRGFTENLNLFLVLKAFWMEDILKSQILWNTKNPSFQLHQCVPVLLSPFFLERCRGNHAVLEVWDAHSSGDRMVGLAKLPLQTFYLAYQDPTVVTQLLESKLPVVSVDHWVSVVHPLHGVQQGELLVLLAFGSDHQVAELEFRRGLRSLGAQSGLQASARPSAELVKRPAETVDLEAETENINHKLEFNINKISSFPLFETMTNGEADCFVDWKVPVKTLSGPANKSFVSDLTLCTLEPRFTCHNTFDLALPPATTLTAHLASSLQGGISFRVWCRLYQPVPRDIIVANAVLPISDINKLEEQFKKKQKCVSKTLSLPLSVVPCPETSKICDSDSDSDNGNLFLKLSYSALCDTETVPKQLDYDSSHSTAPSETKSQASQTDLEPSNDPPVKVTCTQTALQLNDFIENQSETDQSVIECTELSPKSSTVTKSPRISSLPLNEIQYESPNNSSNEKFISHNTSVEILRIETSSSQITTARTSIENPRVAESTERASKHHHRRSPVKTSSCSDVSTFRAHVEVERAVRLPCLGVALGGEGVQPSTYVSLQGERPGELLTSPVAHNTCDPAWDWHCDTRLPAYLLLQENQHLIFKVWQPVCCEGPPNSSTDSILCFAAVGVWVLLSGLPQISGWFNLLNFAGQCHGQIKLCITPLESLTIYRQLKDSMALLRQTQPLPLPPPPQPQEQIKLFEPPPNPYDDLNNSVLEKKLHEQMAALDSLTSQLREKVGELKISDSEAPTSSRISQVMFCGHPGIVTIPLTDAASQLEAAVEANSSSESSDSDVSKLLSNFDLETLHRLVEQLDDEAEKFGRCSKPDFVCRRAPETEPKEVRDKPQVSRQAPEGGNPAEKGQSSTSTTSDSSSGRKRSVPE